MEINTKIKAAGVNSLTPAKRSRPADKTTAAGDSFTNSTSPLESALSDVPDIRAEAVQRARSLINDPTYPSAEILNKLSNFLAGKLTSNVE